MTSFKTYKQSSESLHQGRAAWAVTKATNAVCRFDITSWFPGLQLSVFVFLSIVVSSLGLLGQLSAVLGLFVLVSSALRVRWPEGSLLLGIGAGTEYTKTHTHQRSRGLAFSFDRPNVNGQHINTRAVLPALLRVELSPYWLRTVEVGFWQFHRDGVDVWVLLGDFQLCRQKSRPRYVRTNTTFITNTPQDILTLHRPHEATSVYAALSNSPYLNDRVTFLNNTHMQVNEHVGKVTGCLLFKGQYTQNEWFQQILTLFMYIWAFI